MIPILCPAATLPHEPIGPFRSTPDNRLNIGILFVGAGPANLVGAIRMMQRLNEAPELKAALGEIPVAVLEKGKYVGAHLLAGAVMNPVSLRQIFPHATPGVFPFDLPVQNEALYYLTARSAWRLPLPPTMYNEGNYAVSLSRMGKWLA